MHSETPHQGEFLGANVTWKSVSVSFPTHHEHCIRVRWYGRGEERRATLNKTDPHPPIQQFSCSIWLLVFPVIHRPSSPLKKKCISIVFMHECFNTNDFANKKAKYWGLGYML